MIKVLMAVGGVGYKCRRGFFNLFPTEEMLASLSDAACLRKTLV